MNLLSLLEEVEAVGTILLMPMRQQQPQVNQDHQVEAVDPTDMEEIPGDAMPVQAELGGRGTARTIPAGAAEEDCPSSALKVEHGDMPVMVLPEDSVVELERATVAVEVAVIPVVAVDRIPLVKEEVEAVTTQVITPITRQGTKLDTVKY